jgi:hypothetical protein
MLYGVIVQTETPVNGWRRHSSSPTFYLDSDVLGITSADHARRIVVNWLSDLIYSADGKATDIAITVVGEPLPGNTHAHTVSEHNPMKTHVQRARENWHGGA